MGLALTLTLTLGFGKALAFPCGGCYCVYMSDMEPFRSTSIDMDLEGRQHKVWDERSFLSFEIAITACMHRLPQAPYRHAKRRRSLTTSKYPRVMHSLEEKNATKKLSRSRSHLMGIGIGIGSEEHGPTGANRDQQACRWIPISATLIVTLSFSSNRSTKKDRHPQCQCQCQDH